MVQEKVDVHHIVEQFVATLEPSIIVDKVVLFGSYARGTAGKWSDIDVAVISENFRRMRTLDKMRFIARRVAHCDSRLEALGYSLAEYNHAERLTFLGQIKRTGKVIYTRRKHRAKNSTRANSRRA